MLRRVNTDLFEAPAGARIQLVAELQGSGPSSATFEYGSTLPTQTILGLPGCSFTVEDFTQGVEAFVVFDPAAPGSARYDLLEVEGGVKIPLGKFVLHSDSSPQIGFALQPVDVPVAAAARRSASRAGGRKAAKKRRKKPARRTSARRRTAAARRRMTSAPKRAATKKTGRGRSGRKTTARKAAGRRKSGAKTTRKRQTSARRKAARKR